MRLEEAHCDSSLDTSAIDQQGSEAAVAVASRPDTGSFSLAPDPPSDAVVQEALTELGQYLSDSLAPLMVADSLTVLTRVPPHKVAAEIGIWAAAQHTNGGFGLTDYYFHGLRKVHIVGEFRLLPPALFDPFFQRLQSTVLSGIPESERERLASELAGLSEARTVSVEQVARLHRPGGADALSERSADEEVAPSPGVRLDLPPGFELNPLALRRLEALLNRLAQLAPSAPPARRDILVAEAFTTVARGVSSSSDMDAQLAEFRSAGLAFSTYELFRALGEKLPGWWAPGLASEGEDADHGLAAMEQLITLAEDRVEASRRFREMIENGVEQFNSGALGRAVRIFDLALKMIDGGEVVPESIDGLRERGHEALDPDRIAGLLEDGHPQAFPRAILRFFHAFAPDRLLDSLKGEERRVRRTIQLALLETHGDDGREAVFNRLVNRPEQLADVYLLRNLVHLLRRIPRSVNTTWSQEHEIARIIRFMVPESPLLVIQEIAAYLSSTRNAVASQTLRGFLRRLREVLGSPDTPDDERPHLRHCVNATCRALAGCDDPRSWDAVVRDGVRWESEPVDAQRRLAALGRRDLAEAPRLVSRLIDTALEGLGEGADEQMSPEREARLSGVLAALASTRTPPVQTLLETVSGRFPKHAVGEEARRLLDEIDAAQATGSTAEGGLVGDLDLFTLPSLLQMLAEVRSTGIVTLTNQEEEPVAQIVIDHGVVMDARTGELQGCDAAWQLIERPFAGRFAFIPHEPEASSDRGERLDMTGLILEGMKRHDELRVAEALVPGDVPLMARVESPPPVAGEDDERVLDDVWGALAAGRTVRECEQAVPVDAFRIWRAAACWLEADAFEPAPTAVEDEATDSEVTAEAS